MTECKSLETPKVLLLEEYLDRLRELLVQLMAKEGEFERHRALFQDCLEHYQTRSLRREHQLIEALLTACSSLLFDSTLHYYPETLPFGAAPFSLNGIFLEDEVPLIPEQTELGVLWAFIGKRTGDEKWTAAAVRLAEWHSELLDHNFCPFPGLFTRESSRMSFSAWGALLFKMAGEFGGCVNLVFIGGRIPCQNNDPPRYREALEMWFEKNRGNIGAETAVLSQKFLDLSTATLTYRSDNFSFGSTLFGYGTGLGSLVYEDLKIAAFGPQNLPFGECSYFGIENGPSLQEKYPSLEIYEEEGALISKGRARTAYGSKYWIELENRLAGREFFLQAAVFGLEPIDHLAFVFFANARACRLENGKTLIPKSLNNERGAVNAVTLVGERAELKIEPVKGCGSMEVIPLAGGGSFWGADFLIGFPFISGTHKYSWKITPSV